jgi:hypothetical protein
VAQELTQVCLTIQHPLSRALPKRLLATVVTTDRRNTLSETQKVGCMRMNQKDGCQNQKVPVIGQCQN